MSIIYIGEGTHDGGTPCDYSGIIDNYLYSDQVDTNYGTNEFIHCDKYSGPTHSMGVISTTGLVNLSDFTVTDARLYLQVTIAPASAETITARRLLKNWGELTSTWNKYDGTNAWGTAGALGNADRNNSVVSGTINVSTTGLVYFTGSNLIADVQDMIDNPSTNYGWHLERTDGADDADYLLFASSQNTTAGFRPYLMVTGNAAPTGITIDGVLCSAWNGVVVSGVL